MSIKNLDTPCIGVCSTIYGDEVCLGCKRFYDEIINWNGYDTEKKSSIFSRLEQLIVTAVEPYLSVSAEALLKSQLICFNIRYREQQNPLCWAYYLLRHRNHKMSEFTDSGVTPKSSYHNSTPQALYKNIEKDLSHLAYQAFLTQKVKG